MAPVIWHTIEEDELPPLRWRTFRARADSVRYGIVFYTGPEWAVHVDLGRWFMGIERAREEDD